MENGQLTEDIPRRSTLERYGYVIKLKLEKYYEYVALHADAWPGVLQKTT